MNQNHRKLIVVSPPTRGWTRARRSALPSASGSPPTRGWTAHIHWASCAKLGFPAHAGMDPRTCRHGAGGRRFPRPRGDGPELGFLAPFFDAVSPPTRGWTHHLQRQRMRRQGFPAHAGMDLRRPHCRPRRTGFPRPRGDGPYAEDYVRRFGGVSPPTRGWTLFLLLGADRVLGFPAHAGMDRKLGILRLRGCGFPRPRGDGPTLRLISTSIRPVSPPTRGWTVIADGALQGQRGFPAHAGMDLRSGGDTGRRSRFPRPRGDGPSPPSPTRSTIRVSPPTRGWTPDHEGALRRRLGFPAHAGMDPLCECRS